MEEIFDYFTDLDTLKFTNLFACAELVKVPRSCCTVGGGVFVADAVGGVVDAVGGVVPLVHFDVFFCFSLQCKTIKIYYVHVGPTVHHSVSSFHSLSIPPW